ncbi:MAG: glycosyltransferase family 4 protein [Roseateles sp.]|uniref:glycosyltransferase family 4 protein n=1 Tax=Roseateles sp. TaxID=1971397 RepID=UPI004036BE8F
MRILVLSEAYPSPTHVYAMGFVHSRSLEYVRQGHEVTVLSFSAATGYAFEGVDVRTADEVHVMCRNPHRFDVVFSHAPNLRNHLRLLRALPPWPLVFFLHGHEVLLTREHYPQPYAFDRNLGEALTRKLRAAYDPIKLWAFRRFCQRRLATGGHLGLVFVSEWMRREALRASAWLTRAPMLATRIIPNAVNPAFIERNYQPRPIPDADFVCIRPFDNPKYAIDEVVAWANACPELSFHVFGRGRYFEVHPAPSNMTVFQRFIPQAEIPALLDRYRACVLPTRLDSQGVMACEMATYGIPLFTSDLAVTRQMLGEFDNVRLIPAGAADLGMLRQPPPALPAGAPVRHRYLGARLATQELAFAGDLAGSPSGES